VIIQRASWRSALSAASTLAGEYLRAAALIDADSAAVGEMLAAQEVAAR